MDKEAGPRVVGDEIIRLKRHEIEDGDDKKSKDVYLKHMVELFPFLFVDFEIKESMINDGTTHCLLLRGCNIVHLMPT